MMTPADLELVCEALAMAASRKESMARGMPNGVHHAQRALAMRSLRRRLQQQAAPDNRGGTVTTSTERSLVGWFEANNCDVQHDGKEWFAWIGGKMIPITEIAVAIALALPVERARSA